MLNAMSDESGNNVVPPVLPPVLLEPWPVIVVGALAWLVAAAAAFLIPDLATWRPMTLAGLGVGVLGTTIFLLQRDAVRRGSRGAQKGLTVQRNSD
jgi:hypothetical protein